MATNINASDLLNAQARLTEVFAESQDGPSRYEYNPRVDTAKALLAEHTADARAIADKNGNCQSYIVYWPKIGDKTLDYNDDGSALTLGTTISSGVGPETDSKTYTHNMYMQKIVELDDSELCGNLFDDSTLIAERMLAARVSIVEALNTKFVNFLDSTKTGTNNDSNLPTGMTFASSLYTIDNSVLPMTEPDTLTDLDTVLINNQVSSWFYVSGRHNFYNAKQNAKYRGLNDNERDHLRFDDYNMYFDPKHLDSTLSGENTFAVGHGSYVFWNHIDQGVTPVAQEIEDRKFEYFFEDPELMVRTPQGMQPLRYHVFYTSPLNGGNKESMRRTRQHRWEITLFGGLWAAPAGSNSETGIFKFKRS